MAFMLDRSLKIWHPEENSKKLNFQEIRTEMFSYSKMKGLYELFSKKCWPAVMVQVAEHQT